MKASDTLEQQSTVWPFSFCVLHSWLVLPDRPCGLCTMACWSAPTPWCKGGSRILKWEVNFCNNVREIKYYFNIWGIRKKRKKEAQKKGGENSPISPPLDPPLLVAFFQPSFIIQWAPLWCCQTCCRPWTKIYWRPHSSCVMVLCALHSSLVQSASESWPSGSVMGMFRSATRQLEPSCGLSAFVTVRPRSFLRSLVRGPLCTHQVFSE